MTKLIPYRQLAILKGIFYSKEHLGRLEKEDEFPKRVKIGKGHQGYCAWIESEVDQWIEDRIAARDALIAAAAPADEAREDPDDGPVKKPPKLRDQPARSPALANTTS